MNEMEEIIGEFLVEASEGLDQFDHDLVELEKDPASATLLASIFRTIHTIKGSGGSLGFPKLAALSHVGESVLSRMRDGVLVLDPEITTALLAMADSLRRLLAKIGECGEEGGDEYTHVESQLARLLEGSSVKVEAPAAENVAVSAAAPEPVQVPRIGEILISSGTTAPKEVEKALKKQSEGDPRRIGEILVANGDVEPGEVAGALKVQAEIHSETANSTIRIDVGLLDKLMNLVGELVLARNQILQFTGTHKDAMFLGTAQRLNLITTELQEGVMKTRMQPIGTVWNKLPRVVRDLALSCGKSVEVEMTGADTELDKTILESIKNPLTHIVRNAIDHGIETPEVRAASGKPATGRLLLRAFHEGGQVNIEISDDGAGIRSELVKQKAIAKGIITAGQAARMSERDIISLVFVAGVSTSEAVTSISGRGVGMDVVKTNIEKIGGTIDLQSSPGKGMTIKIKIPLTLAIIPALVVTSGGERFAIPQVGLVELVRVEGDHATRGIEFIKGTPVYRLRGRLLPIAYLNHQLKLEATQDVNHESINIVVLQAGDHQFGLVVDEINDTEEIVVKPLSKQLKSVPCFAGATIMGDGRVALILDVMGLAQIANVVSEVDENAVVSESATRNAGASAQQNAWLLFKAGERGRMAIPLSLVSRLEEFSADKIEQSAGRDVIQYRGQIMPLVHVADVLGQQSTASSGPIQVIVYSENGRCVGLVVDEIVDIADQDVEVIRERCPNGILGTAVIQQRVTDLFNVNALFADAALAEKGVTA